MSGMEINVKAAETLDKVRKVFHDMRPGETRKYLLTYHDCQACPEVMESFKKQIDSKEFRVLECGPKNEETKLNDSLAEDLEVKDFPEMFQVTRERDGNYKFCLYNPVVKKVEGCKVIRKESDSPETS